MVRASGYRRMGRVASLLGLGVVVGLLAGGPLVTDQLSRAEDKAPAASAPAAASKKTPLSQFMQVKLSYAQSMLDGLVTEDFDKILRSAESLGELSQSEQWRVSNDAVFRQYSSEFERTVKQAMKAGKTRSLDSAALAYVQLTMSCVECHKFVRNELVMQAKP
jgi:hypothetical protein